MARPGFTSEVGERTPPALVAHGDRFRRERFPLGTRVVYPADSLPPVPDVSEAVTQALDAPLDSEPLSTRLRPGMRLTIVFDDITTPVPVMRAPDLRARILEAVLTQVAAAGVDDVALVAANGLNRRMTEPELLRVTGERVFRSFYADGLLTNHDAEDADNLADLGEEVRVNKRVAESDLVVQVRLVTDLEDGAAALATGVGSTAVVDRMVGLSARQDPAAAGGPVAAVSAALPVFRVDAVLDNDAYAPPTAFLGKREWEWSIKERAAWPLWEHGLPLVSPKARRRLLDRVESSYHCTAVVAGAPDAVGVTSRKLAHAQLVVDVSGQADVVVVGVGHATPYSVGAPTNPVLAAWAGVTTALSRHTGTPVLRDGGALVLYHPLPTDFSPLHHPAYVDFYAEVLAETADPDRIRAEFEERYATDPWYVHLYRTSQAFHGLHPFHVWYELSIARRRCGDVVVVGGDRQVVQRLGFRAASTFADALEIVASGVGRSPSISYLHTPPRLIANVT